MINILTDSTADLPMSVRAALGIEVIPMYIQLNGKVYRDGDDIDGEMLFKYVEQTGKYPTTSAPSPADFLKFFCRDNPSIYIGVSSKLSTTFKNAQLAMKELGHRSVDLIDSLSFSTGYGQVVLQAAKWRNEGLGFKELGRRIRDMVRRTRGIFILDTLDYIYHGGRCSAIEHFVSSILKIHPFLDILPDGTLHVRQKVRGSRIKAVNALLDYFKEQLQTSLIENIIITHLNCDDEVEYIIDELISLQEPLKIETAKVGCALATHSGPKPLGIAYSVK